MHCARGLSGGWLRYVCRKPRAKYAEAGGTSAATVDEAVKDAAAVITLLPDGKIVRAAVEGFKAKLAPGTVVIDMSSSAPMGTRARRRTDRGRPCFHRRTGVEAA